MKKIVFEEVAKLFENIEAFDFLSISQSKKYTSFVFLLHSSDWYFYIKTSDIEDGYINEYREHEKQAYEILKENGYVE